MLKCDIGVLLLKIVYISIERFLGCDDITSARRVAGCAAMCGSFVFFSALFCDFCVIFFVNSVLMMSVWYNSLYIEYNNGILSNCRSVKILRMAERTNFFH